MTKAIGATPVQIPARDYGHDLEAIVRADTKHASGVYRNQTTYGYLGERYGAQDVHACALADCLVVLDEAYFEYAQRPGYPDGTTLMAEYPNLMVTRTFSKVYGLASMRIGYALSSPEVADLMNRVRQPFNVNDPCMAAAEAALHDTLHLRVSVDTNAHGMQVLEEGLHGLGYATIPSIANFITFDTGTDASPVTTSCCTRVSLSGPSPATDFRNTCVSIGTEHENRRFLAALERIIASA